MVPAALPIPRSLRVEALLLGEAGLTILAASAATSAPSPLCGQRSDHIHSRDTRTPADLPRAGASASSSFPFRSRMSHRNGVGG